MRRQFVLDDRSERLLDHLAASRAGNRSFVIREAIALYARLEDRLDQVEGEPGFQSLMRQTAAEIESGRVVSHARVKRLARRSSHQTRRRKAPKTR